MNILYVLNSGTPGGMEQHVLDLVKGMVSNGNKVVVACKKGEIANWYADAGATVYKREIRFDIDLFYISFLINILKKENIDIVHAHELKAVANSLIAGLFAGTKVKVTHTHTPISEWQVSGFADTLVKFFEVTGYAFLVNLLATKEIALTDSRRKIKGREGIFRSKLEVIPNGLDIDRFNIPSEKRVKYKNEFKKKYDIPKNAFVFGNVSRLTVEKGHSILLEAFAEFLRFSVLTRDDFYLVLAGGGELAKDLKKQAKELEIDDKVIITGVFEEEDKVKFYSLFDVFVFPSLAEGFGIVLIEAMCMGIPVISSDLPVLKEVGTDTVDFFKTGSHGDLADKMEKTYSTINLSKVKAAKDRVLENYSHAGFVNNYLKLYINLLLQEK